MLASTVKRAQFLRDALGETVLRVFRGIFGAHWRKVRHAVKDSVLGAALLADSFEHGVKRRHRIAVRSQVKSHLMELDSYIPGIHPPLVPFKQLAADIRQSLFWQRAAGIFLKQRPDRLNVSFQDRKALIDPGCSLTDRNPFLFEIRLLQYSSLNGVFMRILVCESHNVWSLHYV
jgi:hypothetical protein